MTMWAKFVWLFVKSSFSFNSIDTRECHKLICGFLRGQSYLVGDNGVTFYRLQSCLDMLLGLNSNGK